MAISGGIFVIIFHYMVIDFNVPCRVLGMDILCSVQPEKRMEDICDQAQIAL